MKTIYKYTIPVEDNFSLELPKGAEILTVQEQHGSPQIWALVNPDTSFTETRNFRLAGTGHLIEEKEGLEYIGTFQLSDGAFIGHLFEMKRE